MAELIYRVSTDWQEVEKLFKEIEKLNGALDKVNTGTPREEVEKLTSKIGELKAKYEEMVNFSQQANDKLADAFKNVGSSDNPFKQLGEGSEKATKLLTDSFDSVISKVCELYDYTNELKGMIGSLSGSSGIFSQIAENIGHLSDAMKNQELSLSNQATQNNNIIQQHQMEITALSQQSVQTQNLTDAAGERVSVENEVANTIESTTSSINSQTEAIRSNADAIKEQHAEIKQVDDEYSNAAKSEERWLSTTIEGLEQQQREINEKIANATDPTQIKEYERQYQQIEAAINRVKADEEELIQKTDNVSESAKAAFNIYTEVDENGNPFRVMAESAEDADAKIQIAKDSLEAYPIIMERISEKANDMRLNAYMTDEGERLVKEAERITQKMEGKGGLANMFGANGETVGEDAVNRLSDIEEKLDNIHNREKEIEAENEKLAEQQRILDEEAEKRNQASISMRTQIMQTREEMIKLIAAGKQGTPEFMNLAEKAGEMREQLQTANAYMQYFDNPNRGLATLKTGLQGVAGAAGLVVSTIGLFNEDSKKMAEIQTKVQSVLGIVVGLETTYNLVKKQSIIMMAIEEVKTWAIAKARGVQAAATTAATTAQEGLNVAMMKNPYGAIIALLVTLGAAIWAVTKALTSETDAEKKAREEKENHIKEIKKQQEDWANSVAQSASKQIVSYQELQRKWKELGDDMEKKKKFIKDNQTAFHYLGLSVDSVSAAENVLVKNTDAVVNAIMARAKAAAYQRVMEEQYEKEIKARLAADKASTSVENGGSTALVREGENALNRSRAYYNAKEMGYQFNEGDTEGGKWTKQGVERIAYYNKLYKEKHKQAFNEREKVRRETAEKETKATEKLIKKELDEAKKTLEGANIQSYEGGKTTNNTKEENARKKKLDADRKLAELMDKQKREESRRAEDLEYSTRQAEIDAMDESSEKKLAQIKLNHDKEINAIKRSYEDLKLRRIEEAKKAWEGDYRNEGKDFYKSDAYRNAQVMTTRKRVAGDELAEIQRQEMELITQNGNFDIISKLREAYGNGNVDIIARPIIDAARLATAGWKDVGDGIATVYSMQETVLDAQGNERQILFTPILPDGNVMTPKEIEDYLKNVLDGAQDFLEVDTNKLIIKVGDIGEDKDLGGNDLHLMQENLYKGLEEQIKALYDKATDSEYANYLKRIVAEDKKYTNLIVDEDKRKLQSMREYLKEYGDIEQKRLAIAQEYAEKIKLAEEEGDMFRAASLRQKAEEEDKQLQAEQMRKNINWNSIFQDVLNYDLKFLDSIKGQLEKAIKDGIERGIDAADLKVFADKLQEVKDAIASKSGGIFSSNGIFGGSWMDQINSALQKQKQLEDAAISKREEANRLSFTAQQTDTEKVLAQEKYADAVKNFGKDSKEAMAAYAKAETAATAATKAQAAASAAGAEAAGAESAAAGNSGAMNIAITDAIIHGVNQNLQSVKVMMEEWGLGSEGVQERFAKFAESSQYATDAFDALKNGDIAGVVFNLGNAFNTLGEWAGLWTNSNAEEIMEANNRLAAEMNLNTEAVNQLTEAMKSQSPEEAFKSYTEAMEFMKANEEAQRKILENYAYLYDGGHSLNADLGDLDGVIKKIFNLLKITPSQGAYDLGGLLRDLTAQDWKSLFETEEGRDLIKKLNIGIHEAEDKGNYNGMMQDILDYMNTYSEEAYRELMDVFLENVTNITFDSMYDGFVSSLMDMDKKAEDFAHDFEGYLRNAIYQSMAAQQLKPMLDKWYQAFAERMKTKEENGNYLSQKEINELMQYGGTYTTAEGKTETFEGFEQIKEAGFALRDSIEELGLYNGKNGQQQSATANSIMNISYDQADAMEGTLIAQLIVQEQIKATLEGMAVERQNQSLLTATPTEISGVYAETRDIAADSRDILAGMAIHVEEIRDGVVDTIVPRIKNIDDNLVKVYRLVEEQ